MAGVLISAVGLGAWWWGLNTWAADVGTYDKVRTAITGLGVITVGGGAAIAFRRQTTLERQSNLDHSKERRATHADLHARYQQAAGQLGHERAVIRTAGVYALEALANEWGELGVLAQRGVCVDLLCGYLRTSPETTIETVEGTERTVMATDEADVRRTITTVLARHLHSHSEPGVPGGWSDLDYDFTEACFAPRTDFSGAHFTGKSTFSGAIFTGPVTFVEANFCREARFSGSLFHEEAEFDDATFENDAYFSGAGFKSLAEFTGVTCSGDLGFEWATFAADAWFSEARFLGEVSLDGATFFGAAQFGSAVFRGLFNLRDASFPGDPMFIETVFQAPVMLGGAEFATQHPLEGAQVFSPFLTDEALAFGAGMALGRATAAAQP